MDSKNQNTDAASIRPVSSLRSHFEGLRASQPQQDDVPSNARLSPLGARQVDGHGPAPQVRQSLELPRPVSPWLMSASRGTDSPKTPVPSGKRSESPPKSNHKRPLSMQAQPSPQLTPSVNIESPRSPPRGYFERSASRSPERIDSTPFAKVRDLISQHSSASSTRATTPRGESPTVPEEKKSTVAQTAAAVTAALNTESSKFSMKPPPINRADKPKIPAKPTSLPNQNSPTALVPDQPRSSFEARVSPFNTPPSSDGMPSPETNSDPNEMQPTPMLVSGQPSNGQAGESSRVSTAPTSQTTSKTPDARFMGFVKPATVQDKRDPRALGFASPTPAVPKLPVRENPVPARANTVSERPLHRDPRDLGFSNASKPQQRVVSENIHAMPPPTRSQQPIEHEPFKQQPVRDARLFGFSPAAIHTEAITEEPVSDLTTRRIVKAPPPRPSEESKNNPTRTIRQTSPGVVPDRSTKPGANPTISRAPTVAVDGRFPPPPKRYTDEMERSHSPQHQTLATIRQNIVAEHAQPPSSDTFADDSDEAEIQIESHTPGRTEYPDTTQANRRPPVYKSGLREIHVKSDSRVFDVCGQFFCTAGYVTRVFDMSAGEQIMGINHGETVKVTAVAFKPATELEGEGARIWIGNNIGELHEIEVATHSTVSTSSTHNRREIVQILRQKKNLWTLDDDGKLCVWPADESGVPNLRFSHVSHKIPRGHTFSLVEANKLWVAFGKDVRVYKPGHEATFAPLTKPLIHHSSSGDITSGAVSREGGGRVYFGHTDGKVSIYSTKDYSCIGTVKASDYKINGLAFVADKLWAAYKTGKIYVYDTSSTPWKVQKDWHAHQGPVAGILLDPSSVWTLGRLQVASVGHDNHVRLWDGLLEDDWIETAMHAADIQYCRFREIRAAVVTWNAGASTPHELRNDFIADAMHSDDPPEILVFGFQEVVDLEDRTATAKSIFGFGKKKDVVNTEQHQSRVYREWRDYLSKVVSRYTNGRCSYSELHTSSLVGLFQCIFVRHDERSNVRDLFGINVKCGLKGHYGNKGALVTRFVLDDSTLCFVNCHLAAGQTSTSHRNNDIANILESESMPAERDDDTRMSLYIGGGDGTQILDHEICVLNGDLNYRIDAIPRNTVIDMIKRNDLTKLLDRDQLLVSRRRVSGFRLAAFTELPITFAPTYKYDVGTDTYDSSEKKRAPAWCDRVLYRGPGRVKQIEYRRHEVKVSDHRPVSGMFKLRVKTIDPKKRAQTKEECHERFVGVKRAVMEAASVDYLVKSLGMSEREAWSRLQAA